MSMRGAVLDACDIRALEAARGGGLRQFRQGWAKDHSSEHFHGKRIDGLLRRRFLASAPHPVARCWLTAAGQEALDAAKTAATAAAGSAA